MSAAPIGQPPGLHALAEFDKPGGHANVPPVPRTDFPDQGRPEVDVLGEVRQQRLELNRYDLEKNFCDHLFPGMPSAISRKVEAMASEAAFSWSGPGSRRRGPSPWSAKPSE